VGTSLHIEISPGGASPELARMLVGTFAASTTDLDDARMAGLRRAVGEACSFVALSAREAGAAVCLDLHADGDRFMVRVSAVVDAARGLVPGGFPLGAGLLHALVDGVGLEAGATSVAVQLSVLTRCRPPVS
jgi:hypothetical protein